MKRTRSGRELADVEKPAKKPASKQEAAKITKDSTEVEKGLSKKPLLKTESVVDQVLNGESTSFDASVTTTTPKGGKGKLSKPTVSTVTPDEKTAPPKRGRKRRRKVSKPEDEEEKGMAKKPLPNLHDADEDDKNTDTNLEASLEEPKRKCRRQDSSSQDKTKPSSPAATKTPTSGGGGGGGPHIKRTCSNCSTLCENTRAKKCQNCKMFFYNHWAQRCRIPPCPKCHYNRKARGCTMLPKSCERCGHPLPGGSMGECSDLDATAIPDGGESGNGSPVPSIKLEADTPQTGTPEPEGRPGTPEFEKPGTQSRPPEFEKPGTLQSKEPGTPESEKPLGTVESEKPEALESEKPSGTLKSGTLKSGTLEPEKPGTPEPGFREDTSSISATTEPQADKVRCDSNESTPDDEEKDQASPAKELQDCDKISTDAISKSQDAVCTTIKEDDKAADKGQSSSPPKELPDETDSGTYMKDALPQASEGRTSEEENIGMTLGGHSDPPPPLDTGVGDNCSSDESPSINKMAPPIDIPLPACSPSSSNAPQPAAEANVDGSNAVEGETVDREAFLGDGTTTPSKSENPRGKADSAPMDTPSVETVTPDLLSEKSVESTGLNVKNAVNVSTTCSTSPGDVEMANLEHKNSENAKVLASPEQSDLEESEKVAKSDEERKPFATQESKPEQEAMASSIPGGLAFSPPPPVTSSHTPGVRARDSDCLPQISEMMSNIANATTVIAGSSKELKKSLEEEEREEREEGEEGGMTEEMQGEEGEGEREISSVTGGMDKEVNKDARLANKVDKVCSGESADKVMESSKASRTKKDSDNANLAIDDSKSHDFEPKPCDVPKEGVSSAPRPSDPPTLPPLLPQPARSSQVHVLGGPGLNTVMSVSLSQILNSLPPVSSVLQPILVPNKVAITSLPVPILSSTHQQMSLAGVQSSSSPAAAAPIVNSNFNLPGLAALMLNSNKAMTSNTTTTTTTAAMQQMLGKGSPSNAGSALLPGVTSSSQQQPTPPQPAASQSHSSNFPPAAAVKAIVEQQAKANRVRNQSPSTGLLSGSSRGQLSVVKTVPPPSDAVGSSGCPKPPPTVVPMAPVSGNSTGGVSSLGISEALKMLTSLNTISSATPPLKTIPERTVDNSVIKLQPLSAMVVPDATPPSTLSGAKVKTSGSLAVSAPSNLTSSSPVDNLSKVSDKGPGFPARLPQPEIESTANVAPNLAVSSKSVMSTTNFDHKLLVASISQRLDASLPVVTSTQPTKPPSLVQLGPPLLVSKPPFSSVAVSSPSPLPSTPPPSSSVKPADSAVLPPPLLSGVSAVPRHASSKPGPKLGSKFGSKPIPKPGSKFVSKPPALVSVISKPHLATAAATTTTTTSFPTRVSSHARPRDVMSVAMAAGESTTATTEGLCGSSASSSAFHKLDLSSPTSSARKIRVSLLKQNMMVGLAKDDPVPMSSETDTSPSFPQDVVVPGNSMSSQVSSKPQTPTSSSSAQLPGNGNGGAGGKFQNFAVSPKLSVIATVETAGKVKVESSSGDDVTASGGGGAWSDSTTAASERLSAIGDACPEWSIISATGSIISKGKNPSKPIPSSSSTTTATQSGQSADTGNLESTGSAGKANSDHQAVSKVQTRVLDSPESDTKSAPSPLQAVAMATTVTTAATSSRPSFRKILPNLTKSSSSSQLSISCVSTSPVSHIRTPGVGVVTVQVCSSIPASLTLSSITNPSIAPTNVGVAPPQGGVASTPGWGGANSDGSNGGGGAQEAKKVVGGFPGIIKPRGVVAGGGNVMVTPLSPTMMPAGRTVAQIVTSKSAIKEVGSY